MKRLLAASALIVAVAGVFALTGPDTASATNAQLNAFTGAYPATAGTSLANCSTCHTTVPQLNPYGAALRSAGFNFSAIENADSDGDGFTNLEEIRALTLPGNAGSAPAPAPSAPTTTSTMSTTSTTSTTGTAQPTPVAAAAAPAPLVAGDGTPYDASPAGTVWLKVEGDRLVVTAVDTDWAYSIEEEFDDDGDHGVEVKFRSGEHEVEFEAELEDGAIKTKVELEDDDLDDDDHGRQGDDDDHDDDDHDDDDDDHDEDDDDHDEDDDHARHDDDDRDQDDD